MEFGPWHKWRLRLYLHLIAIKRRITLGARVMMIDGDRIYLIRHTYLPGWHMPGGGVEPGEAAAASGAREVMEESGYRLTGPLQLFGLYHNTLTTSRDHVALYISRQFEQANVFKANLEIAEFGWFAHDALPPETSASTLRRVAEVFDGAPRSENW
ncbi:MAG: NUDIX domain-containing protein [Devosia sp.]|nr:NUDIX domain-containing protein [Devosia sp.]